MQINQAIPLLLEALAAGPDLCVQLQQLEASSFLCEHHGVQQGSVLQARTLHLPPPNNNNNNRCQSDAAQLDLWHL